MSFSAAVLPVSNGYAPDVEQGPRVARVKVTLAAGVQYVLNMQDVLAGEQIDKIQTIYIDNRDGLNPTTINSSVIGLPVVVPAFADAILPFFLSRGDTRLLIDRADAGTVTLGFLNVPLPAIVYGPNGTVVFDPTIEALLTPPNVATKTNVAANAADVLLLAANTARKGASVFNDSVSATLYLSLGTVAASAASYTVQLLPGQFYETLAGYTGQIRGIWSAAVGNARITEQT